MSSAAGDVYKRVLLKLSGEALAGQANTRTIDASVLRQIAEEIGAVVSSDIQVGVVVGGGNLFRGSMLNELGINRVVGDQMGMLATMINGLAARDALEQAGVAARIVSALGVNGVIEQYDQRNVNRYLEAGEVVIFAAGTGNPFFTTDTAACLRAIEIGADLMLKATKVDGVYDSDPVVNPQASLYPSVDYDTAINNKLAVMDATALCLARDNRLPLHVFNINNSGCLLRVLQGAQEGTRVS